MDLRDLSNAATYLFSIGADIMATTVDKVTNVILAQLGDSTTEQVDSDAAEVWGPIGWAARAAAPTQGAPSCQALALRRSDRDIIFATRDVRGSSVYGNIAAGEACAYAPGSQARTLWKADGSVNHLTTDSNKPTGNAVFSQVSPTGMRFWAPFGTHWQDASGFHLRTFVSVGGVVKQAGKIDLGPIGLPAPFNLMGTTFMLTADAAIIDVATLQLGRDQGASGAAILATPWLTNVGGPLETALTDIATALSGLGSPVPSVAVAVTAIGAVVTSSASKTTLA